MISLTRTLSKENILFKILSRNPCEELSTFDSTSMACISSSRVINFPVVPRILTIVSVKSFTKANKGLKTILKKIEK